MRVAVLDDYQDVARKFGPWDKISGAEVVFFHDHLSDDDSLISRLSSFDVVVAMRERTPFSRKRLERLPKLRLLVTTGGANSVIDLVAARDFGITVSCTRSDLNSTVELTWALILATARKICDGDVCIRAGGWQSTVGMDLHGNTLGVLGLGRQGSRVAAIGVAFGMNVIAWSQNLTLETADTVGAQLVSKDELFEMSDVVTVHLRLSERTTGIVGKSEMGMMKRSAIVVNTSRGPIIDEEALVQALTSGSIAGAGLDTYSIEPLPSDSPLRFTPNTVLSPHVGYVSSTNYGLFFGDSVEDIVMFRAGTPIRVLGSQG